MDTKDIKQNAKDLAKNLEKPIFTKLSLVLVAIGIIGAIGIGFALMKNSNKDTDTIVLDNTESEEVKALTDQIVYETGATEIDYYSPTLDAMIKYSKESMYLYEGVNGVTISPVNAKNVYASLITYETTAESPLEEYIYKYTSYHKNAKVSEIEDIEENMKSIHLTWNQEAIISDGKINFSHTVIQYKLAEEWLILDISSRGNEDINKYIDQYVTLLQNITLHPEDVDQEAIAKVPDLGITVKFNRSKWSIASQTEASFSLNYLNTKHEKETYQFMPTSIYISGFSVFAEETPEEVIDLLLQEYLTYAEETDADKDLEVITKRDEADINKIDYVYAKYKIKSYDGKPIIKSAYFTYNKSIDQVIRISIRHPGGSSNGQSEAQEVLNNLEINQVEQNEAAKRTTLKNSYSPNLLTTYASNNDYEIDKAAILGKSAVVHIFNKTCVDVTFTSTSGLQQAGGNTYEVCSAGLGSGFYINNDGDLVTNAHVATPNVLDTAINGMIYGYDPDSLYNTLLYDTIRLLAQEKPDLFKNADYNDPEFLRLIEDYMIGIMIYGYQEGYMTVDNEDYKNYIQTNAEFEFDTYAYDLANKSDHKSSTVIDYEEPYSGYKLEGTESEQPGVEDPDLAILNVEDVESNTALKLANIDQMNVGQKIYVFGFPGVAENQTLFSSSASKIPTITQGTISAIKPNSTDAFNLIQIDASISHGNSGGPITNPKGEVIGVATYGISFNESADFNAGVSVEEVLKMLEKNNVPAESGKVTVLVEEGLNNFSTQYYKWAIEDFEKAIQLNESTKTVLDPLISISRDKIEEGEDNTPIFVIGKFNIHKNEAYIGMGVLGILFIGVSTLFLILVIKKLRKRRAIRRHKKVANQQPQVNQPPNTNNVKYQQQNLNQSKEIDQPIQSQASQSRVGTQEPSPETPTTRSNTQNQRATTVVQQPQQKVVRQPTPQRQVNSRLMNSQQVTNSQPPVEKTQPTTNPDLERLNKARSQPNQSNNTDQIQKNNPQDMNHNNAINTQQSKVNQTSPVSNNQRNTPTQPQQGIQQPSQANNTLHKSPQQNNQPNQHNNIPDNRDNKV